MDLSPICTYNECTNGHTWIPQLGLVNCAGCNSPVLAMLMVNCPQCNEPIARTQVRTDHTPKGPQGPAPIIATCKGAQGPAETIFIELSRQHASEIESANPVEPAATISIPNAQEAFKQHAQ